MTLRLEPAELSLEVLARAGVDAVAAFVGPARPFPGLAGLIDWRLCGAVSRAVLDGTFVPERGEVLLLPGGRRLPARRVVCFGLPDESAEEAGAAVARAAGVLARAGCRSLAVQLPGATGGEATGGEALLRAWLEASVRHGLSPQIVLGDPRALARQLGAAAAGLDAEVALGPPHRAEAGERDVRLPVRGPVVR
jgi:hypothetical protein